MVLTQCLKDISPKVCLLLIAADGASSHSFYLIILLGGRENKDLHLQSLYDLIFFSVKTCPTIFSYISLALTNMFEKNDFYIWAHCHTQWKCNSVNKEVGGKDVALTISATLTFGYFGTATRFLFPSYPGHYFCHPSLKASSSSQNEVSS